MRALRAIFLITAFLAAGPALAEVGVFPIQPTANDPVEVIVSGSCACGMHFEEPPQLLADNRILIRATANYIVDPPIANPFFEKLVLDPLPAGTYRVDVEVDGELTDSATFFVGKGEPGLYFPDSGVLVKVQWENPHAPGEQEGKPIPLTSESGYFYFFDWTNAELTVKLLDGRPINGHWWLFMASMTTLDMRITVTDCTRFDPPGSCRTKTYVHPAGQNRNFVDISTF